MTADFIYLVLGIALLFAIVLPRLLARVALSAPLVLVLFGVLIGLVPPLRDQPMSPAQHGVLTEHVAELTVLIALMGVGLALDRPLRFNSWDTWRAWRSTWRLLFLAMPMCIAATAFLGWWALGFAPATALLLGAVLAPTDPVLAADVQVEGPTTDVENLDEVDERDEVRFALTSEGGLNDALAFPFVYAAIYLLTRGPVSEWGWGWVAEELFLKTAIGLAVGVAGGWIVAKLAFSSSSKLLRFADRGEPLVAVAATLATYGLAELLHGWGFLSVFACAMTIRTQERGHEYNRLMHEMIERLELLLTLCVLLLLGIALADGLLNHLTWASVAVGLIAVFVIRPVTAWLSLGRQAKVDREGDRRLGPRERLATAFLGVRGIGSVYYVAYALNEAEFPQQDLLWSTVAFTIVLSVVVHGIAATPLMNWLDCARDHAPEPEPAPGR